MSAHRKNNYLGNLSKEQLDEFFQFDAEHQPEERDVEIRLRNLTEQIRQISQRLEKLATLLPVVGNRGIW